MKNSFTKKASEAADGALKTLSIVVLGGFLSVRNWDFFSLARGTVALYNLM